MKRILPFLLIALLYAPLAFAKVPVCTRSDYTGNAATTSFTYACGISDKSQLEVLLDGVTKTVDSDYTVNGVGTESGGSVVFTVAPGTGVKVTILRKQPLQQTSDYVTGESFPASRLEADYDNMVRALQMLGEQVGRAPKLAKKSLFSGLTLPDPVASKNICFNSGATDLTTCDSGAVGPTGPQGPAGAAGSPGGAANEIQFNSAGVTFSGVTGCTSDGTSITCADDNLKTGSIVSTNRVAPGSPAAGKTEIYVDSTSKNIAAKNDAGTVNHGVQTKAAVATNFLTGINDAGAVAAAQPAESDLSFTDITTNDVSITTHGFAPKAPNDATKFLNGVGAWAVPAGGGGTAADVQIFTATGANTWTRPASPKTTCVYLVGGGGGGGSGRRGAAGTTRTGGVGGGGAAFSEKCWPSSILGVTETATVGAKGTGGAAQTSDSTNGNAGNGGTNTTFGSWLKAGGGGGGPGGLASTPGVSAAGTGLNGGGAGQGAGVGVSTTLQGAAGGGAGGQVSSVDVEQGGFDGGNAGTSIRPTSLAGGTGAASACGAGGAPGAAAANEPQGGAGGGGGGGCKTANGGAGAAGGRYGAAGGGGGGSLNGFASGAGGDGADGIAIVVTYF